MPPPPPPPQVAQLWERRRRVIRRRERRRELAGTFMSEIISRHGAGSGSPERELQLAAARGVWELLVPRKSIKAWLTASGASKVLEWPHAGRRSRSAPGMVLARCSESRS